MQKRMLLQVPEQREAAEREIRTHRILVHNENVIKLMASEIKDQRNGEGVAYLLFPYYQVSVTSTFTEPNPLPQGSGETSRPFETRTQ